MTNECIPFYEAAYTQKITVHAGTRSPARRSRSADVVPGRRVRALAARSAPHRRRWQPASPGGSGRRRSGRRRHRLGRRLRRQGPIIRGGGTILPVTSGAAVAVGDC
jgi:hypothetical protein